MNLKPILFLAAALLVISTSFAEESREWTSSASGRQFKGALVKVEGELVSIRREADNEVFQFKKADLIQADLDWIKQNSPKNEAAGQVEDLSDLVSGIPAATGTPAIGVLLVIDGETRGIGVSGIRKAGDTEKVESGDKWHLGSCTKSITATLAGNPTVWKTFWIF
ncbi:MAG: CubicO group peptidase (beta-lactamase class C family) [Verrucomicrobiales bacterium]|jgi:CubicO group peptidase (beta-lactamase class C family)